jgi:hypothetical protein
MEMWLILIDRGLKWVDGMGWRLLDETIACTVIPGIIGATWG